MPNFKEKKAKKWQIANALNMRPANFEGKPKEQIKQRHACRCRARRSGKGRGEGCTRKEDDE
jgi:hypothetical protein